MVIWKNVPSRYQQGFAVIAGARDLPIDATVTLMPGPSGLTISRNHDQGQITYGSIHDLMRAVTLWLAHAQSETNFAYHEQPAFEECGAMIDVARNGVLTVSALKQAFVRLASLGYTEVWLYLEDVFEIPDVPEFGRGRGRYTQAQLHELAVYADQFGLRLVPAIQTLAHLQNALKWRTFQNIKDTDSVLWVEKPETTAFLRQMLQAATAPFLTNKIHIGMDEAYGLGHGNRLISEGYVDQQTLIMAHLKTVVKLCEELDLDPYMWSDLWFTFASPTNEMYDPTVHFDAEFAAKMPQVGQVYWDYYHQDVATYTNRLAQHLELKQTVVYAGGLWTWAGLAPHQEKMLQTVQAGMTGAKQAGVKQVVATMWFDDGAEAPFAAAWLGLQTFIEYQYHDVVTKKQLADQFALMQGENFDAFMLLDLFDQPAGTPVNLTGDNPSKILLYEDCLLQKYAKNLASYDLVAHYQHLAQALTQVKTSSTSQLLFAYYHSLALTLMKKAALLTQLQALKHQPQRDITACKQALVTYRDALQLTISFYRQVWFAERRGQGQEVVDIRLGGQLSRLDTLSWRLERWAVNEDDLPELDETPLLADKWSSGPIGHGNYQQIASFSNW